MRAGVMPRPLVEADDEAVYGGKAVSLGAALRAGLPVPPGVALPAALVDEIAGGAPGAVERFAAAADLPDGRLAVRSSAIGEDSSGASFAGQHVTHLNVLPREIPSAVRRVWESARSDAALAYRTRRRIDGHPAIGVVIQKLVESMAAGVLFTRNPLTGANERVIEAAWGLGESVVSGLVAPDSYRLDAGGRLLEQVVGMKDVKVWFDDGSGTSEVPVPPALHDVPCLHGGHLEQLHDLADRCTAVWGGDLDLEWAFACDGTLYLLQSRPITAVYGAPA